ncbi:MAG: sigma 54-interacting transcriptional regulator [Sodalis sp. (in: enterobacteria)]
MHLDVRLICATQNNLLKLTPNGYFRKDVHYRLNALTLTILPLRERPEDIIPLASLFFARFYDEQELMWPRLAPALVARLRFYPLGWATCRS